MKFNLLKKVLVTAGVLAVTFLAGGLKADAAGIDFNTDLKGYAATISTVNGKNVISTKKGTWDLDENSQIYSSKTLIIYLNNTEPVKIDSIYAKATLDFRGSGELVAETEGQFGINVGTHLRAWKTTKNGVGKVTATGTEAGIRVENEVQMEGGAIEAYGTQYGLWCNNDIKPHYSASIKAVASNEDGIGIWAYRDIYAYDGASVYGEGGQAGGFSKIAHIDARDGSTIHGVSRNINSPLSALHTEKKGLNLRSYRNSTVIEEYVFNENTATDLNWQSGVPFKITDITAIKRNMSNLQNYSWSVTNGGVVQALPDGLLVDGAYESTLEGVRSNSIKSEPTEIKAPSRHILRFSNITVGII